ncbi:hypothetical protein [Bradyrhizobium sp.]|uniref:hypothetical protein n=1 Tax=Bradyrhizobium sp. TaxID=376 RepID=UPI00271CF0D3|nr:hypothetical protein [Bradyrhizobium sp.]MDO9298647.1 hypothetical protein [Bradyrhizobium sp.]
MRRCVALILFFLGPWSAAEAEPISIRCADDKTPKPYFATFDLDSKRVVFESSMRSFHAGQIKSANDDQIEFSIKADYGNIDLVWERQRRRMTWAGISADPIRPFLIHRCAIVEPRTLLSESDDLSPTTEQGAGLFSLRCATDPSNSLTAFFTLDRKTRKVVMLTLESQSVHPGEIQSASEYRTEFSVGIAPKFHLVWDSRDGTVTWKSVPNDSSRPTKVYQCKRVEAGSVLMLYEGL